jgi:hypothetical protein
MTMMLAPAKLDPNRHWDSIAQTCSSPTAL